MLVQPFLNEVESDEKGYCSQRKNLAVLKPAENSTVTVKLSTSLKPQLHEEYLIYLTYLIVGIYGVVIFIIFVMIIIKDKRLKSYKRPDDADNTTDIDDNQDKPLEHSFSKTQLYFIYFIFFWMILFYGGIEVSFSWSGDHFHLQTALLEKK